MTNDRFIPYYLKAVYFFTFFGFGGLYPLLGVYLREQVGLSGAEIGIIMSIGPIIMIFTQPFWGIVSDYFQKPRTMLTISMIMTGGLGLLYLSFSSYVTILIVAALIPIFQGAIVPLSDSITLNYVQRKNRDYGSIRLWGAAGFSLAVLAMGSLADLFDLSIIFFGFAGALWLSALLSIKMPKEAELHKVEIKKGISRLVKNKNFSLFMLATFLIFGPIYANNFYFGILIQDVGGSLTGVGIAFLLAAGSEIPFMKKAGSWIQRFGFIKIVTFATLIATFRWGIYIFEPTPIFIYSTTFLQGLSVGLFIPAGLQFVRNIAPEEVRVTAVTIYSAVGGGIGASLCTFFAGVLLEQFNIFTVYMFFSILTGLGAIVCLALLLINKLKIIE